MSQIGKYRRSIKEKNKGNIFKYCFWVIGVTLVFIMLFSCYSKEDLRQRYNQGYSDGNKAGYNKGLADGMSKGRTEGYNAAKNESQKQINELQNRIDAMERNHKTELTVSYNKGFQEGENSMEKKILAIVDVRAQEAIRRNKKNEPLFRVR